MVVKDQFEEFRKRITYKERLKGKTLKENGLDEKDLSDLQLKNKKIEIRIDPLFGRHSLHTTLISEERTKRPLMIKHSENAIDETKKDCVFCKPRVYSETAVPKMHYGEGEIVTIPNLFPSISPHFITIFTNEHKTNLKDLTEDDVANYLFTGREIAKKLKEEGQDGMWDYINWGNAGASQPHPHAQRGGLYKLMRTLMDKEAEVLEKRTKELDGKDPFEVYMDLIRKSKLLIYEDENVFVFAPYAPRFTDQVDILTKKAGEVVSDYSELKEGMIDSVSRAMIDVLRKLETKRGVTSLNIETHQSRFGENKNYRLHWHIYPRTNLISGMELHDMHIVSAYPEDTAKALSK